MEIDITKVKIGDLFDFNGKKYLKLSETDFVPYFETVEDFYKSVGTDTNDSVH